MKLADGLSELATLVHGVSELSGFPKGKVFTHA
jgi:hypothetical protein